MNTSTRWTAAALVGVLAGAVGACSTAPTDQARRDALYAESNAAVASFTASDPTLRPLLDKAVAWVAFPDVGRAGFIVGASHGRGMVFERGVRAGYASLTQGSFGLQAGAQTFRQLVVFVRDSDYQAFRRGSFALGANASAVALRAGAAGATDLSKGVIVFVEPRGGLMAEAAISGQIIRFEPTATAQSANSSGSPAAEPAAPSKAGTPNW